MGLRPLNEFMARVAAVVSNACAPDPRVQRHARWLAQEGHDVVIHAFDREQVHQAVEEIDGYTIKRYHIGTYSYGGGFSTLRGKRKFIRSLKIKADFVICNDADTLLLKFEGKRIFDMHDLAHTWPLMQRRGPLRVLASKWMKTRMLVRAKKCDAVITSSPGFQNWLANHDIESTVVTNRRAPIECPSQEKLVVGYVGRIREIEPLLHLQLAMKGIDGSIIIAGDGTCAAAIKALIPEATHLGAFTEEELGGIIQKISVMYAMYDPERGNIMEGALPVKMFDAAAYSRPSIVNANCPMGQLCEEESLGKAVQYGDIEAIRESILKLHGQIVTTTPTNERSKLISIFTS